jgi:hypothetical protein
MPSPNAGGRSSISQAMPSLCLMPPNAFAVSLNTTAKIYVAFSVGSLAGIPTVLSVTAHLYELCLHFPFKTVLSDKIDAGHRFRFGGLIHCGQSRCRIGPWGHAPRGLLSDFWKIKLCGFALILSQALVGVDIGDRKIGKLQHLAYV